MAIAIMKEKDPNEYCASHHPEKMVQELMKTRLIGALEFATFEFLLEDITRAFTHQLVRHRTFHFSQQSMRFFNASESGFLYPKPCNPVVDALIQEQIKDVFGSYQNLIKLGCPVEDARSILPTNVLTKICFGATFRGLLEMCEVRLCQQTQSEFREVAVAIKESVTSVDKFLGSLLVPACVRSGKCEFKSIYDRPCEIEKTLKGGEQNGSH
jgi:flavin-dependent thymidylate synthase